VSGDAGTIGGLTLSVIVPAFNEERLLESSVGALRRTLDEAGAAAEIILVDDGSSDRTGAIADSLATRLPGVRAHHQFNQGIGGAFLAGAALARGEYVMLWPADMLATPGDFAPYAAQFGRADVIVGCRSRRVGYNPLMRVNAWIYPRLVALLFGLHIRDVNWIHAYRRTAFLGIHLTQHRIPMLAEALVRLRDASATFVEVDVEMKPRQHGVPSASRPAVMWATLTGLLAFWKTWRSEKRLATRKDSHAAH
jgi:glycosyltransferase involved in cell wall biosynthesis